MARPRSDIRPRILSAARDEFAAHGVDAASLRKIARLAKTSVGMIHYYFPTKDDLFLAVVEEVYDVLLAELSSALGGEQSVPEQVTLLYGRFARLTADELVVLRLIVREALGSTTRLRQLVERFKRGHVPLIIALVGRGQGTGSIRKDVHLLGLMAAVVTLGTWPQVMRTFILRQLGMEGTLEPLDFSNQLADILWNGIGPGQGKPAA